MTYTLRTFGVIVLSAILGLFHAVLVGLYSEVLTLVTWLPVAGVLGFGLGTDQEGHGPRGFVIGLCLVSLLIGYGWIYAFFVYSLCDRVPCV